MKVEPTELVDGLGVKYEETRAKDDIKVLMWSGGKEAVRKEKTEWAGLGCGGIGNSALALLTWRCILATSLKKYQISKWINKVGVPRQAEGCTRIFGSHWSLEREEI